jgi:hypothetical protein
MIDEIDGTGDGCPVCGSRRWWPSRTGRRICQQCYRDPLEALHALAEPVQGQMGPTRATAALRRLAESPSTLEGITGAGTTAEIDRSRPHLSQKGDEHGAPLPSVTPLVH